MAFPGRILPPRPHRPGLFFLPAARACGPRSCRAAVPPPAAQAINKAAGGTGAELTPQDIALAASQQSRTQPQPPSLQELHVLARRVNAQPLVGPSDKQHGIKLPTGGCCAPGARTLV